MNNDTSRKNESANSETNEPEFIANLSIKVCAENITFGDDDIKNLSESEETIRQRLYWVADNINQGQQGWVSGRQDSERENINRHVGCDSTVGELGNTEHDGHFTSEIGRSISESETEGRMLQSEGSDTIKRLANTFDIINERKIGGIHAEKNSSQTLNGENINKPRDSIRAGSNSNDGWSSPDWIYCRDNKYRPVKSGIKPLAHGLSRRVGYSSDPSEPIDANNTQEARVMRLKGYGNAICPQIAAKFISAFMVL